MAELRRFVGLARLWIPKIAATTIVVAMTVVAIASCVGHSARIATTAENVPAVASKAPVTPVEVTTPVLMPPFQPSDVATAAQLDQALGEGTALRRELEWVEREEAVASGELAAGEYIVTYLITPADDYYDLEAATTKLPVHHTTVLPGSAHIAVVVRDAADGRMVQGLHVRATVRSETGEQRSSVLPFGWHPILNRYGDDMILPEGPFSLTVHISMPEYHRQDRANGDRFTGDVSARFADIHVSSDSLASAAQRLARGDSRQAINLARQEGTAIDRSLAETLHDVGVNGSQRRTADYSIVVIARQARGYWEMRDKKITFVTQENNSGPITHIEATIRDLTTSRFVPGLDVRATIIGSRKKVIGTYVMPFTWNPWMNHYGLNVPVPGSGRYTIRVRADAPSFRRYGTTAAKKFSQPLDVEFRNIRLAPREL